MMLSGAVKLEHHAAHVRLRSFDLDNSASGPQLRSLKGDARVHEGIRDGEENSSMADECGGPSTTSGCIYNSLALRIVRSGEAAA